MSRRSGVVRDRIHPRLRAAPASLRSLQGAPHVDGWPVLDAQLQWCDGLSIVGALAALTLGPAAGNLGGARAAADALAFGARAYLTMRGVMTMDDAIDPRRVVWQRGSYEVAGDWMRPLRVGARRSRAAGSFSVTNESTHTVETSVVLVGVLSDG